ncbi:MAG: hypothetical protein PSX36_10030 [bacterium]|nr:hypothetical protein [bacterium]
MKIKYFEELWLKLGKKKFFVGEDGKAFFVVRPPPISGNTLGIVACVGRSANRFHGAGTSSKHPKISGLLSFLPNLSNTLYFVQTQILSIFVTQIQIYVGISK